MLRAYTTLVCYEILLVNFCRRMWIKKILNVNIINFEKEDKAEGRGGTMWIRLFCKIFAILIYI